MTTQMLAPPGSNLIVARSGNTYVPDSNGLIQVNQGDVTSILNQGALYATPVAGSVYYGVMPTIVTNQQVASVTVANLVATIAAQPDMPRRLKATVTKSSGAFTAGTLTFVYVASNGATVTDVFSLVISATTNFTTSCAVLTLTSVTIAGLAGGGSYTIIVGTTDDFGLPVPPNAIAVTVTKAIVDLANSTLPTVVSNNGWYTSPIASNATKAFAAFFSYILPG